jgi:hypothetical protein
MASTGTKAVLIMCDGEGFIGPTEKAQRLTAGAGSRDWSSAGSELLCAATIPPATS